MRLILFKIWIIILVGPLGVGAQISLHASWGQGSGNGGTFTYSIGQAFTQSVSISGTGSISEGVQQSFINITDISQTLDGISIYPNPTTGILNLRIQGFLTDVFSYRIYNNLGQCVQEDIVRDALSLIILKSVAAGIYRIEVKSTEGKNKIFQILKLNQE